MRGVENENVVGANGRWIDGGRTKRRPTRKFQEFSASIQGCMIASRKDPLPPTSR